MELIVENGGYFKTVKVDYHGGLRYPHLERAAGVTDVLTDDRGASRPVTVCRGGRGSHVRRRVSSRPAAGRRPGRDGGRGLARGRCRAAGVRDWPAYGGGPAAIRYSPLAQITRANVKSLQVAWTYDSGEEGGLQTNPIVVGRTLYTTTPLHKTVALDAATGAVRWTFDSGLDEPRPEPRRDVLDRRHDRRASSPPRTTSSTRSTRRPASRSRLRPRAAGSICTKAWAGPPELQSVRLTTPGVIYRDLLIVGGRVNEGLPASPGDIRALRRPHRRAALDLPHHSRTRRGRRTTRGRRRRGRQRRRQQLGRHGARRSARHRVRADRIGGGRLLRRRPHRRQPVRQLACSRSTPRPASGSGISRPSITTSGIATSRRRRRW